MDFTRTVVIDNGSGVIKAGFGGQDKPSCLLQNVVGRPKHAAVMSGGALQGDMFVGDTVEHHRGVLRLTYPMEHGHVTNWSDMEAVWSHLFGQLGVPISEHPVLLTEAPLNSHANKEKAAEILFEQHHIPSLFFSVQAVLSLYAAGTTTGIVADVGDGVAHVCPVYEGFVIPGAVGRSDIAGRDVTSYLQLQLRQRGYNLTTSAEFEIVRQIKEQLCYVAKMPQKEEEMVRKGTFDMSEFRLPDGAKLHLGAEMFRPTELLFDPKLIGSEEPGVSDLLACSIKKCDIDVRKELFTKMYISGGSTLFKGFGDRLLAETRRLLPNKVKCKLHAPPERKYTTWLGGAILANLTAFRKMMITAETYRDEGARCLHKQSFL
eukprot:TRINITY_DN6688_c0_g3_i1.p1 TRINITY_DN6688_c0_g3~~TRINITY_DN6688_c0_g3_i1.p1  ORF type:complete len:376 (+),score=158.80 TRINITY_DN6688_c0_g3_i1:174-1301(+)